MAGATEKKNRGAVLLKKGSLTSGPWRKDNVLSRKIEGRSIILGGGEGRRILVLGMRGKISFLFRERKRRDEFDLVAKGQMQQKIAALHFHEAAGGKEKTAHPSPSREKKEEMFSPS